MKLLIVEDEQLLARQLIKLLLALEPEAELAGQTNSIESTLAWLKENPAPDLVLMDIELADGQCFEIFHHWPVKSPVIFTTAYDEYALRAFKVNSIDYLLKPIQPEELRVALDKWKEWKAGRPATMPMEGITKLMREMMQERERPAYRERFLVKQGQKLIPVNTEDVAFFTAKNTLNFITTKSKQQYLLEYTLDQVEALVPPGKFFRANRQYLLAHDMVAAIHPWFNGKLKVDTRLPLEEDIIISREKAPQFRAWLGA